MLLRFLLGFLLLTGIGAMGLFSSSVAATETASQTAYDFSFATLMGGAALPLAQFKGKVLLVVNTASKCGFTPQYDGLEKLYDTYKDRGLVIVGVPSDDFGHQEPGSNDEIAQFCKVNYGVTFPMAAKEDVLGANAHPFYKWAKATLGLLSIPKWNFHKYLVSRDGRLVDYFHSTTAPDNARLIAAVEKELSAAPAQP